MQLVSTGSAFPELPSGFTEFYRVFFNARATKTTHLPEPSIDAAASPRKRERERERVYQVSDRPSLTMDGESTTSTSTSTSSQSIRAGPLRIPLLTTTCSDYVFLLFCFSSLSLSLRSGWLWVGWGCKATKQMTSDARDGGEVDRKKGTAPRLHFFLVWFVFFLLFFPMKCPATDKKTTKKKQKKGNSPFPLISAQ